ncbi:hypothetical protein CCR97_04785 [Rhodoplanes elegans]|nr:hypothetical protein [Rhodoplanes elegans]
MIPDVKSPMQSSTPDSQLQPVGAGAYVWRGADGESNAGAVDTGDSLLVVDTQQNESLARTFRATLADQLGKPIRAVVNTHYHLDHVAGNEAGDVPGITVAPPPPPRPASAGTAPSRRPGSSRWSCRGSRRRRWRRRSGPACRAAGRRPADSRAPRRPP